MELVSSQDSPELIPLLIPDIRPFLSQAAETITVDLGQSLKISCPAHGTSHGAVYTWSGDQNIEFTRNARRAISPAGELFIMFVTDEDIDFITQVKGISCTMTGANTIYKSGPRILKKRQQGNDLLYYILYCLTVGCCGIHVCKELHSGTSVQGSSFGRGLCVSFTVPPETIYPLGCGKTSSLPKCSAANSLRWDKFLNLILARHDRLSW